MCYHYMTLSDIFTELITFKLKITYGIITTFSPKTTKRQPYITIIFGFSRYETKYLYSNTSQESPPYNLPNLTYVVNIHAIGSMTYPIMVRWFVAWIPCVKYHFGYCNLNYRWEMQNIVERGETYSNSSLLITFWCFLISLHDQSKCWSLV